jgi:hypothetical protein
MGRISEFIVDGIEVRVGDVGVLEKYKYKYYAVVCGHSQSRSQSNRPEQGVLTRMHKCTITMIEITTLAIGFLK